MRMKTVLKWTLSPETTIGMPDGCQILSVQFQGDDLNLWAIVDTYALTSMRRFRVYVDGQAIPDALALNYIGTSQTDGGKLAVHVFEDLTP